MIALDDAHDVAKRIFSEARNHLENIKTEEDAKLQIITRVLTEALGWDHSDISSEHKNENG
jgi:vacuolar-type H+-ATPase subunit E/Vma4